MISAYHRPRTLEEARTLLSRPNTRPLGGGTLLSHLTTESIEAVDLQALGLNSLKKRGNNLEIGATVTLGGLQESELYPEALKRALKLEAPLNVRNAATVAGTIVACDGRSTFTTALLALDAKLTIASPKTETINLGDYLPLRPPGLIILITIPLQVKFAFEYVARTPADKPIACVALAQWPSNRTRLAVGGYGKAPMLAMDGTEANGAEAAARNAFHGAADEWASAEYRTDVAARLATRCRNSVR
jgi:CO/xanthine dehydrogenase FAD-binding subunit